MPYLRTTLLSGFLGLILLGLIATPGFAEDKSFYSPIISVNLEEHKILISTLGAVFWIDVPDTAKPHLEKLPISGLADFVVEMKGEGQAPLLKSWKIKSGESTCKYFDGAACK
jgi:hypothetical protein